MSNIASDNLHRLIKSMSKPEKRYFKVFSSRHIIGDENNYQVLFDAIDRQDEYNEEKLLKKFKEKAISNRFSIAKNRLYVAILKSLDAYHSTSSIEAQLHRQVHGAEILYHKSLYDQSLKILHSARKQAKKHELYTVLAEIGRWEKRILEKNQYEEISSEECLDKTLRDDREIIENISTYNELWNIKSRVFQLLYRQGKVRSKEELAEFKTMIDQMAQKASGKKIGTESTYLFHHVYSAYHFSLGEYAECYPHLEKNMELIDSKPQLFDEEPNIYLSVLTNAIYVGMRLGKWDEAFRNLEKLRHLPEKLALQKNEDLEIRLFALTNSTELALYAQSGDFDKGLVLIPAIEAGLKRYGDHLSSVRKAQLYFNIAVLYFGVERFHESLKWINRLLNDVEIDKSKDIHCMAQILNLVIHLELRNDDLLPYALRSTQRFLETRNKVFRFENEILEFINNIQKKRQDKSREELFEELSTSLENLRKDTFERTVFEYFDFLAWAKSKVSGKSYREQIAA